MLKGLRGIMYRTMTAGSLVLIFDSRGTNFWVKFVYGTVRLLAVSNILCVRTWSRVLTMDRNVANVATFTDRILVFVKTS